jgi:hypothetical protein
MRALAASSCCHQKLMVRGFGDEWLIRVLLTRCTRLVAQLGRLVNVTRAQSSARVRLFEKDPSMETGAGKLEY